MNIKKIFDSERRFKLDPDRTYKSFYGKAVVVEDLETGDSTLYSYGTPVCSVVNGEFRRLWEGYSSTTMRHVNAFLSHFNLDGGGKAWWDAQPVYSE